MPGSLNCTIHMENKVINPVKYPVTDSSLQESPRCAYEIAFKASSKKITMFASIGMNYFSFGPVMQHPQRF